MTGPDRAGAVEVTVLGIGNPLAGDDGIGEAIASRLAPALPRGARIRLADGDPLAVLEELEAGRRLLVVDAARFAGPPAAVRFVALDRPEWRGRTGRWSLHGFDLAEVFRLGRALGLTLAESWVMAVRPAAVAEGQGLSPALSRALPRLVDRTRRATLRMLSGLSPEEKNG